MKRAILSVALAIAFMAGVSAQDKPNFAGKWKADNSYSSVTITVEGSKMTVTNTVAGNSESTVYLLDGTPSKKTFEGPNGPMENVYTSTWEGDVLVTAIKTAIRKHHDREAFDPAGWHDEDPEHSHHGRQAFAAARARAGVEEDRVASSQDVRTAPVVVRTRARAVRANLVVQEQIPPIGLRGIDINRREFLGITAGAGASLALTPELLRALQQSGGKLIQRAIPSSGEMLPVISFAARGDTPRGCRRDQGDPQDAARQRRQSRRRAARRACGGAGRPHGCRRARDSGQALLDDAL